MSDTADGQALPPDAVARAFSILMERYDCTEDDANEVLMDWSVRTGVGLNDVVAWLIKDALTEPSVV